MTLITNTCDLNEITFEYVLYNSGTQIMKDLNIIGDCLGDNSIIHYRLNVLFNILIYARTVYFFTILSEKC